MTLELLEHRRFEAAGRPFVYLVPSAAVFRLDPPADAIMRLLESGPVDAGEIVRLLGPLFGTELVETTLGERHAVRAIGTAAPPAPPAARVIPLTPFPLTTMVLNVTNQCNLSCTYCYEYGADKISSCSPGRQPPPPRRGSVRLVDPDLRRALAFVVPYWRRLTLVVLISVASTALSLYVPLLSRDFFDRAIVGRDAAYLLRIAAAFAGVTALSFALNAISGLRYTRVSAEILFDMRLEMYRHLQRLSPRFYAHARMGDIMSRINNDIGEIQRVAAEATLAWVGNGLFLVGTTVMLAYLDLRLFLLTAVTAPYALVALLYYRRRLEREITVMRTRSADIGSFLIETLQATRLVTTSNAQQREAHRFGQKNQAFIDALMSMQWLSYLAGGLPGFILSAVTGLVFVYGGLRVIDGTLTVGTFIAFMAYKMRFMPSPEAFDGALHQHRHGARVTTACDRGDADAGRSGRVAGCRRHRAIAR